MPDLTWIDALKYGPAGLAGIAKIWTAGLLQQELRRKQVRPEAQALITRFMVFTAGIMIVAGLLPPTTRSPSRQA